MAVTLSCTETSGKTILPVIMFNYYICLYNNVWERNGNNTCINKQICNNPFNYNERDLYVLKYIVSILL